MKYLVYYGTRIIAVFDTLGEARELLKSGYYTEYPLYIVQSRFAS